MAIGQERLPYASLEGYDEALLLYVLALGSPTYPLPRQLPGLAARPTLATRLRTTNSLRGSAVHSPAVTHLDRLRGIQDAYMRDKGLDYFENSRRATYVQREYAIRNPREFACYSKDCWGMTASDGPGSRHH